MVLAGRSREPEQSTESLCLSPDADGSLTCDSGQRMGVNGVKSRERNMRKKEEKRKMAKPKLC